MKKSTHVTWLMLTAGLAFTQVSAFAVDAATPPALEKPAKGEYPRAERIEEQLKMLAEKLALTDAQKVQANEILKAEGAKLVALRDNEALRLREKMKQIREVRMNGRAQIRAILTADQQKIFDSLPKRGPGGPGGQRKDKDGDGES